MSLIRTHPSSVAFAAHNDLCAPYRRPAFLCHLTPAYISRNATVRKYARTFVKAESSNSNRVASATDSIPSPTLMSSPSVQEVLPPSLDSTSEPPALFDGTTRLYINYQCPFAQRAWITRNYKGLHDEIKLVPIDLQNRPVWYKEKVYPENKVPSLEHNGKVIGESLDLIKYIDNNFKGPSLLPDDPARQKFADELMAYSDTFLKTVYSSFKGDAIKQAGAEFDYLENALHKFDDGPFFLGQFSQVDIAYAPFVERFHIFFQEEFKYDITSGRPKLAAWIEEINKLDAYKPTKCDPEHLVQMFRSRFVAQS